MANCRPCTAMMIEVTVPLMHGLHAHRTTDDQESGLGLEFLAVCHAVKYAADSRPDCSFAQFYRFTSFTLRYFWCPESF